MTKSLLISIQFFIVAVLNAQQSVHIRIDKLPPSSVQQEIFIAGSFNGWNPGSSQYKFQKDLSGNNFIDLKLATGAYEYKITRGSWKEVECTADGSHIGNRVLKVNSGDTVLINIEGWKDQFETKEIKHTACSHVSIIDTAFWMPQLNRNRRVWIYLPENYATDRFPVLYMHDGQNVFDDATSYAGEWGVDEFLDTVMARSCIVVGIDNGGSKRLNEYCPYDFALTGIAASNISGKGEGKEYVEFIVKTLKPYIDKKYRTLKNKSNTFIAGSSMGGLISMYAVLKYPEVFGGAGVFSPAFWVGPKIIDDIKTAGKKVRSKIYFYAGKLEGEKMVPDMQKAYEEMKNISASNLKVVVREDGMHNEPTWRKEFPLFYYWLMYSGKK